MTRPASLLRFSLQSLLAVVFAVIASRPAFAQPVDDPGMEPTPKPVTPTPKPVTPPLVIKPTPTVKTSTVVASPPMFAPKAPPPEFKETVDVKTTWVDVTTSAIPETDNEFTERLAAPTLGGSVGLFRVKTAEQQRTHSFRIGLHIGGFQQDNFLIAGANGQKGDTNGRVQGDLTVGYTPWKYIELYLGIFNSSNRNQRTDSARTDPEVILSLGDLALGIKGRYTVAKFIDIALNLDVRFLNSVSGISFDGKSTNFAIDAIATFDLRRNQLTRKVPLRFHVNFGFLLDNSLSLLPPGQCAFSTKTDSCIASRVVETFAYGIGTNRLRIAGAVEAPIVVKHVGIDIFLEYIANISVGGGDQVVLNALKNDTSVSKARLTNPAQQWMTIGLRIRPVSGLVLDAGVDIGLQSPGFQYGPPVTPWNVIAGAAFAYDTINKAGKTKIIEKTVTREISRGATVGKLRGVVKDAVSKKPLGNATIKYLNRMESSQLSGDDGFFVSYGFVPGPVQLEVSREDYESIKVETSAIANGETPVEVLLTPKPPQSGILRVRVVDGTNAPIRATVHIQSSTGAIVDADAAPEGPGNFTAKLAGGDYLIDIVADDYLAKQRQIKIEAGQPQSLDVTLTKKPSTSHVALGKGEIVVKGVVHFGTNDAVIKLDGQQLLDEVADIIIRNPQLKKIRIEGHTDNRGVAQKNLELSKARAASTMAYLIKQGVDPLRLDSEGYGASQPLVPNLTPANRAKNRRVAFKIVE